MKREAKDLQAGDVWLHAGMVRYVVETVTPIGRMGSHVEVRSYQLGKPDNVRVESMPANTPVELVLP
jgi:hypothetical protein